MKELLPINAQKLVEFGKQKYLRDQVPNQLAGNHAYSSLIFKIHVYMAPNLPYSYSKHIYTCISIMIQDQKALLEHRVTLKVSKIMQKLPRNITKQLWLAIFFLVLLHFFLLLMASSRFSFPHLFILQTVGDSQTSKTKSCKYQNNP